MIIDLNECIVINTVNGDKSAIRNISEDSYINVREYFASLSHITYRNSFNIYYFFEVINMEYTQPILMFSRFSGETLETRETPSENYFMGVIGNNDAHHYKTNDMGDDLARLIEEYEMWSARITISDMKYPYIESIRSGKGEELPDIQYKRGEFTMNTILKLLKYLGYKYTYLIDESNIRMIEDNEYYNINLKMYTYLTKGRTWYNKFGFVNKPHAYYETILKDMKNIFNESISIINHVTFKNNEYDNMDPHVIIIKKAKACIKNKYYWNTVTYERFTKCDIVTVYKYASIISLLPSVFYLKNSISDKYVRFECRFNELVKAIDKYHSGNYHNLETINSCEISQSHNLTEEYDQTLENIFLDDIQEYISDIVKNFNKRLLDTKIKKNNKKVDNNDKERMRFNITNSGYSYKNDIYKIIIFIDSNTIKFIVENPDIHEDEIHNTLQIIMSRIQKINERYGLYKFSLVIGVSNTEYIHYYLMKSLLVDGKNMFNTYGYDTKIYDMHILKILECMYKYTIVDIISILETFVKHETAISGFVEYFREITRNYENNNFIDVFIHDIDIFKKILEFMFKIQIGFKCLDENNVLVFPEIICTFKAIDIFINSTHNFARYI